MPPPQIVVGPFNLYVGDTGQAFPPVTSAPPFATSGRVYGAITDDKADLPASGIKIARVEEYGEFAPLGATQATRMWVKKSGWKVSGMIANWNAATLAALVEDGTTGKLGTPRHVLPTYAAVIRGIGGSPEAANAGQDLNYQFEIPQAIFTTKVDSDFGLGDSPAMLAWELACLYDADLEAAFRNIVTAEAPTGLNASNRASGRRVTWNTPAYTGGYPITGYRIEKRIGTTGAWVVSTQNTAQKRFDEAARAPNSYYRVSTITATGIGVPSEILFVASAT